MLKHTHDCNSRFSSSIQLTFLFYPILPWMSVKPSRMTGSSPAHGIICSSSNPIIVYTCDGISQVKLITQPISVMSVASSGQLCWLGKSITRQVLQLVSTETRRSSILKDPQHVCSRRAGGHQVWRGLPLYFSCVWVCFALFCNFEYFLSGSVHSLKPITLRSSLLIRPKPVLLIFTFCNECRSGISAQLICSLPAHQTTSSSSLIIELTWVYSFTPQPETLGRHQDINANLDSSLSR